MRSRQTRTMSRKPSGPRERNCSGVHSSCTSLATQAHVSTSSPVPVHPRPNSMLQDSGHPGRIAGVFSTRRRWRRCWRTPGSEGRAGDNDSDRNAGHNATCRIAGHAYQPHLTRSEHTLLLSCTLRAYRGHGGAGSFEDARLLNELMDGPERAHCEADSPKFLRGSTVYPPRLVQKPARSRLKSGVAAPWSHTTSR